MQDCTQWLFECIIHMVCFAIFGAGGICADIP
jgi:hypothetical protein